MLEMAWIFFSESNDKSAIDNSYNDNDDEVDASLSSVNDEF